MKSIFAIAVLFVSLNVFAQDPPEKYQKIWTEIHEGDAEKAIKDLQKIAKKAKKDPWPYWMMGIAVNHGAPTDEERSYYLKSLEADSTFGPAHYSYAVSLDAENPDNIKLIEYHFNKAIQYTADEDNFYYVPRAQFYYDQKRYDEAIADSKKALSLNPENSYFANQTIIKSMYAQGKKEELKIFLKTYDSKQGGGPADPEYFYFLGTVYEEFGDKKNACISYNQAIVDEQFYMEMFNGEEGYKIPEWYSTATEKAAACE